MFWLDAALCSELVLDGIVTVVDAKYGAQVGFSGIGTHGEFQSNAAEERFLRSI